MPSAPPRLCSCGNKVTSGRCDWCRKASDRRRGTAHQRGYTWREWRPLRNAHWEEYPFCGDKRPDAYPSEASRCKREGRELVLAEDVHHIIPHKGDDALRLDPKNLESLCKSCHSAVVNEGDFGR